MSKIFLPQFLSAEASLSPLKICMRILRILRFLILFGTINSHFSHFSQCIFLHGDIVVFGDIANIATFASAIFCLTILTILTISSSIWSIWSIWSCHFFLCSLLGVSTPSYSFIIPFCSIFGTTYMSYTEIGLLIKHIKSVKF